MEKWREDVLIHYGTKGMKWGKRKKMIKTERDARAFESSSKAYNQDPYNAQKLTRLAVGAVKTVGSYSKTGKNAALDYPSARDAYKKTMKLAGYDPVTVDKVVDNTVNKRKKKLANQRKNRVKRANAVNNAVSKINKRFGTKINTYGWFD